MKDTGVFDVENNACCLECNYGEEDEEYNEEHDLTCLVWIPKFSSDPLIVHWVDNIKPRGGSKSILAYIDRKDDSTPERRYLHINEGTTIVEIAYELEYSFYIVF